MSTVRYWDGKAWGS
ncbi:MAG: DUF2510 domain-containing protein [Tannerella sp.]|nr:DUF2510 domain-containing protein [Tannerella sp.]